MEELATQDTKQGLTNKRPLDKVPPIRGCICRRLIEKFLVELIPSSILWISRWSTLFLYKTKKLPGNILSAEFSWIFLMSDDLMMVKQKQVDTISMFISEVLSVWLEKTFLVFLLTPTAIQKMQSIRFNVKSIPGNILDLSCPTMCLGQANQNRQSLKYSNPFNFNFLTLLASLAFSGTQLGRLWNRKINYKQLWNTTSTFNIILYTVLLLAELLSFKINRNVFILMMSLFKTWSTFDIPLPRVAPQVWKVTHIRSE